MSLGSSQLGLHGLSEVDTKFSICMHFSGDKLSVFHCILKGIQQDNSRLLIRLSLPYHPSLHNVGLVYLGLSL